MMRMGQKEKQCRNVGKIITIMLIILVIGFCRDLSVEVFAASEPSVEVNLGYISNLKPYSYQSETGEFCGIARDICDYIEETAGIKFRYIPLEAKDTTSELLREKEISVLSCYGGFLSFEPYVNIKVTEPYLEYSYLFVFEEGETFSKFDHLRFGVGPLSTMLEDEIKEKYPDSSIIYYENAEIAFEKLEAGEIDVLLGERYCVEPFLSKPLYQKFQSVPAGFLNRGCCFAILDYEEEAGLKEETMARLKHQELFLLVNQSLVSIPQNDLVDIVQKNLFQNLYKYEFEDFAYQYRHEIIFFLAGVVVVILCIILVKRNRQEHYAIVKKKNEELALAIEQVNQVNISKSWFLARMSHEIRNPLNAIVGFVEISIREINHPEKVRSYLQRMQNSSRVLLRLVNNILDMSVIENQKMQLEEAEFHFKEVINNYMISTYQQCYEKKVAFEVDTKDVDYENLVGDLLRLQQVLSNLLSNAIKFTKESGVVRLFLEQKKLSDDIIEVRFEVSDTGIGMSDEMKERIFHPFEQESTGITKQFGGSGLGLSITKSIIELMGGTIRVESQVGIGTTFYVTIPFHKSEKEEVITCREGLKGLKILALGMKQKDKRFLEGYLPKHEILYHYEDEIESALEELSRAEELDEPYDICLINGDCPDREGCFAVSRVREVFEPEALKIIQLLPAELMEDEVFLLDADYRIMSGLFQIHLEDVLVEISGRGYQNAENSVLLEKEYNFDGKHVMLAEDVEINMEIMEYFMEAVGVRCTGVSNGKEALECFENSSIGEFDAILLDINMPEMDGYETARAIRSSHREDGETVPIFAVSASAFSTDVQEALQAGMNGHIAKPIQTEVLYRALSDVWEES